MYPNEVFEYIIWYVDGILVGYRLRNAATYKIVESGILQDVIMSTRFVEGTTMGFGDGRGYCHTQPDDVYGAKVYYSK